MKMYKARNGTTQRMPSLRQLENAIQGDTYEGFCLCCGQFVEGFEPDARKGKCPECGADKVYGAEELVLMGLYH